MGRLRRRLRQFRGRETPASAVIPANYFLSLQRRFRENVIQGNDCARNFHANPIVGLPANGQKLPARAKKGPGFLLFSLSRRGEAGFLTKRNPTKKIQRSSAITLPVVRKHCPRSFLERLRSYGRVTEFRNPGLQLADRAVSPTP